MRRREDGYHELASLFQAVDLGDTIEFFLSDQDSYSCNLPDIVPEGPSNLIWKAVSIFRQKTALKFGLKVHLEKKIPLQAGIGGGSSNAATTLWALNQLLHSKISDEELKVWGSFIGSDVSFFFSKGRAYCTGRGEQVLDLPSKKGSLWLVKPLEGLSTPLIFKNLKIEECSREDPEVILKKHDEELYFLNDLEKSAFDVMPSLRILKERLIKQGMQRVVLTGSGTGFICQGDKEPVLDKNIFISPINFISRNEASWYRSSR